MKDQVDKWIKQRRIVGFSPWSDADGLLYGVIVSRKGDTVWVEQVSPTGQPDGSASYKLSEISYFTFDDKYVERLRRLARFVPTNPDSIRYVRKREKVREVLEGAVRTGEPVCVKLLGEPFSLLVTVLSVSGEWIGLQLYDDLMAASERRFVRADLVVAVRSGTVHEECDAFLLKSR